MVVENNKIVTQKGIYPIITEIIHPLRNEQRDFLYLRLVGMNRLDALEVIDRTAPTLTQWRERDDNGFRSIEKFLLDNKERYVEDAAREYAKLKRAKAILALSFIADKAFKWDTLDKVDKQSVLTALRELKDIGVDGKKGNIPYEEMILRRYE